MVIAVWTKEDGGTVYIAEGALICQLAAIVTSQIRRLTPEAVAIVGTSRILQTEEGVRLTWENERGQKTLTFEQIVRLYTENSDVALEGRGNRWQLSVAVK